jgi:hypothetical protein
MLRKIRTQESIQKEKKRNQLIAGIVMTVLIVLSSAGYALMNRDSGSKVEKQKFGNLVFVQSSGYWQTQVGNKVLYFNSLPQNLTNISVSENISIGDYLNQNVYIINSNPAVSTISSALDGIANKLQEGCLQGTNCEGKDLPIKDCNSSLIIYNSALENSVRKVGKCIYLEGDFFASTDKFIYRLFSIA